MQSTPSRRLERTVQTADQPPLPLCIPVCWDAGNSSFLAYHHGWVDPRLYYVVEIYRDGLPQSAFAGYVATVDDFGCLVPLTHKPWIERDEEAREYIVARTLAAIEATHGRSA
jgi:hypothetical protein